MSHTILQDESSSTDDYFQIESHNWKELVNKTMMMPEKISDELLLSISFIHYKHLLPSNVPWLDIFNIYNTPRFSSVCNTFGQTLCSEILIDTVKNIHETRPPLSCSILVSFGNVIKENKILSESLCYCNIQINILYYLVFMPYTAIIGVSIIHIVIHITFFTFNKILNEIYYNITAFLCYNILLMVILLYIFIHPASKLLCYNEWYIEEPQQLFIFIIFYILSICIWILYKHIIISTNKLYHNPYLIIILFSCGSAIFFYVIKKISTDKYYNHFGWTGCVFMCVWYYSSLDIKEGNNTIKCLYDDFLSSYKHETKANFIFIIIGLYLCKYFSNSYWLFPFLQY